ncbi:MAG: hypothetical protein ACI8W8_000193 [Rhodothermales bacterium]|jgi:hypothetical protein
MFLLRTRARILLIIFAILAHPLHAALDDFETGDFSSQPWLHDANNPWQVLTLEGNQVAASATIPNLTDSALILARNTGAGELSFRVKISSEVDYDYLVFYIDDLEVGAWSGEQDWQTVSFPVDAGQHRFEWRYEKDDFVLEGQDRAWIDDIDIPTTGAWLTIDDFPGPNLAPVWADDSVSADPLSFADSAIHMHANAGATASAPLSGFSGPLSTEALRIDLAGLSIDSGNGSTGVDIDIALNDGHTLRIQAHDDASLPLPAANGARIVGGNEATPGDYPWMTALIRSSASSAASGQFCGGTLIHPFWVLSAAHCLEFTNPSEIDVVIGAHSLSGDDGERIAVAEIIVHPAFDSNSLDSDLALLRLERPSSATPLALAHPAIADTFAPGVLATVIGWGALSEGGSGPDELYEVDLPIVSNPTAEATVGGLTDNMIAAGLAAGGKDSCQGDSGGPFMVPNPNGGFLLAGIVSWGNGCARPAQYGIYTRVANFADWVAGHLEGLSLTATLLAPDGSVAGNSTTPVLLDGESPGTLTIRLQDNTVTATHNHSEFAEFASSAATLSSLAFRVSSLGGDAALAVDRVAQFDPTVPIPATLRFLAPENIRVGEIAHVELDILDAAALPSADLQIAFDHNRFQVTTVTAGDLLPVSAPDLAAANASGTLHVQSSANPTREVSGHLLTFSLAEIAGSPGSSSLSIGAGTDLGDIHYESIDASIRIRGFIPNDDFSAAEPITTTSGSLSAISTEAGSEPGEPAHAGSGGASLWYAFTAPAAGQVTVDSIGSDFDTVLAAYKGAAIDSLALLAENDDSSGRQSQIRFFVSAGDLIYIAVDGWKSATGTITLNWSYSFTGTPPSLSGVEPFESDFSFPWTHSATPWTIDANSARSADIDNNESSSLGLLAEFAEGIISFAVKVDCEYDYDFLSFEIDGEEVDYWDGLQDWQIVSYTIPAGVHELRWVYRKDFSISHGADAAWIDQVSLPGLIELHAIAPSTNSSPVLFSISGFDGTASDIQVSNGVLAEFAAGSIAVTPAAEGIVSVSIGNSASASSIYDITAPQGIVNALDESPTSINPLAFSVYFDDELFVDFSFVSVSNGSISSFDQGFVLVQPTWPGLVTLTLAAGAATDAAGNLSTGASASVTWEENTDVIQRISLVAGWNWLSFNVLPADASVDSVLANIAASNGDEFKTAPHLGGTATYFDGSWLGNTQGVQSGVRYLLRVANSATLEVTGQPVYISTAISIVAGWNWLGYTGQQPMPINAALANFAASDGDELKTAPSLGGTATFFAGTWFPESFTLSPGVGYLLHSANAGALSFPAPAR